MSTSHNPLLPPELFDEAIDHLWDDPHALQACSLTCRSWLPSSRLHLFRTVRLRNAEDCTSFTSLLDQSPIITRCVRKLTLNADYAGVDSDDRAVEDDGWVNSSSEVLKRLSRVSTLALSRMRWNFLEEDTKKAFRKVFRTVKTLFLFEVRFYASEDVLEFLSAFTELSELYFHGVSWSYESSTFTPPLALTAPHPTDPSLFSTTASFPSSASMANSSSSQDLEHVNLTYLFLDPRSSPTLVTEWLLNHHSEQQKLRTIQLCWREIENTKPLGDLLQASGSALERLQIEFPSGLSEEALHQNQLTLAHNTGLRSLHFGGLDGSLAQSRTLLTSHLFPWVSLMLSQVRSPLLREVTFELELPDVDHLPLIDWVSIDRELSRREFEGLVVRFYVNVEERGFDGLPFGGGEDLEQHVRREIEEGLKGFMTRGVLRISCI
ncbi:hypothetical protein C8Q75DRAFT_810190 [Abortiporus biennis]|nr:hypothetical protein C8Q75DRAFT_810190 [Abortiporus biennis]